MDETSKPASGSPETTEDKQAIERFKQAVDEENPAAVAECLERNPFLAAHIDDPWFVFDTPAIVVAASRGNRELVDVLLDHGASPNAKSGWWAGSFGTLHHDH